MVHAMNTRTPSTDSKMGLSSSNAGFVAKALGQSIKNKALFEIIRILDIMLKEVMNNIAYACFFPIHIWIFLLH
jgi:hypothetical protein